MASRGTIINLDDNRQVLFAGEPMLDTNEGVLIISFDDGTYRTFNWDYVVDFYYLTEEEFAQMKGQLG